MSGLIKALANLEGLDHPLELHLITTLSLSVLDVLLTRAKARVGLLGRVTSLRPVNILSPLPEQRRPAETVCGDTVFNRKFFSDDLDLEDQLRSALLCQAGPEPHLTLHLSEDLRLSLDLQLRGVVPAPPVTKKKKPKPASTFGPEELVAEGTVITTGLSCSVLFSKVFFNPHYFLS